MAGPEDMECVAASADQTALIRDLRSVLHRDFIQSVLSPSRWRVQGRIKEVAADLGFEPKELIRLIELSEALPDVAGEVVTSSDSRRDRPSMDSKTGPCSTDGRATPKYWDKSFVVRPKGSSDDTFRAYSGGAVADSGGKPRPCLFLLHGAGNSAMSWALAAAELKRSFYVVSYDLRGHGSTRTAAPSEVSKAQLTKDSLQLINATVPPAAPLFIVGHSLGAALAVSVASQLGDRVLGIVIVDAVEGAALATLPGMKKLLKKRPSAFRSTGSAVEWALRHWQLSNRESASVSIPSQLVRQCSTSKNSKTHNGPAGAAALPPRTGASMPPPTAVTPYWTWRFDVVSSERYWKGWFQGMTDAFLCLKTRKCLILAGPDRMQQDAKLTVAQMQGKFMMHYIPGAGHSIQENKPIDTARTILTFVQKVIGATLPPAMPSSAAPKRVVCIGDLHGDLTRARELWARLGAELGEAGLRRAKVIFLGDYVDRGPNSKGVLDWLIRLRLARKEAGCDTVFLCGNHEVGMAAYLGTEWIPCARPLPAGYDIDKDTNPVHSGHRDGFFPHAVKGGMHYQGRRWGAGVDVYDASTTFESYGVEFDETIAARDALRRAVPDAHKKFLRDLDWVHDTPVDFGRDRPCRLIAVHAGLVTARALKPQLAALSRRDICSRWLLKEYEAGRYPVLSGRSNVISMHPELKGKAYLVSGHHGPNRRDLYQKGHRIIVDKSGGCDCYPLDAYVFPEARIVRVPPRKKR